MYTASWAAANKSEVHSQQRFTYVGHRGEVRKEIREKIRMKRRGKRKDLREEIGVRKRGGTREISVRNRANKSAVHSQQIYIYIHRHCGEVMERNGGKCFQKQLTDISILSCRRFSNTLLTLVPFSLSYFSQVRADQAHRGYEFTSDETGYACPNPFYMSYAPDAANGQFQGQYG